MNDFKAMRIGLVVFMGLMILYMGLSFYELYLIIWG